MSPISPQKPEDLRNISIGPPEMMKSENATTLLRSMLRESLDNNLVPMFGASVLENTKVLIKLLRLCLRFGSGRRAIWANVSASRVREANLARNFIIKWNYNINSILF